MKTIGIHDDTYERLFLLKNKIERERKKRISFSDIIDYLINNAGPELLHS